MAFIDFAAKKICFKIMGLIVIFVLTVCNGQSYAQKNDVRIKTGVYVRGEEDLNGLIEDYISKELKSLDNIIVTYSKLDCAIDIIVKELATASGADESSYALSVTIIDRFDYVPLTRVIEQLDTIASKTKTRPNVKEQLEYLSEELAGIAFSTSRIKSYHNSYLYTVSKGQLRKLCSRIVTDFEREYLVEKRRMRQRSYF